MQNRIKTARVIKEYRVNAYGCDLVVPVGATVSNKTASGANDNYRFWQDFGSAPDFTKHDLNYRGLNVPAEYCEPYPT